MYAIIDTLYQFVKQQPVPNVKLDMLINVMPLWKKEFTFQDKFARIIKYTNEETRKMIKH